MRFEYFITKIGKSYYLECLNDEGEVVDFKKLDIEKLLSLLKRAKEIKFKEVEESEEGAY